MANQLAHASQQLKQSEVLVRTRAEHLRKSEAEVGAMRDERQKLAKKAEMSSAEALTLSVKLNQSEARAHAAEERAAMAVTHVQQVAQLLEQYSNHALEQKTTQVVESDSIVTCEGSMLHASASTKLQVPCKGSKLQASRKTVTTEPDDLRLKAAAAVVLEALQASRNTQVSTQQRAAMHRKLTAVCTLALASGLATCLFLVWGGCGTGGGDNVCTALPAASTVTWKCPRKEVDRIRVMEETVRERERERQGNGLGKTTQVRTR